MKRKRKRHIIFFAGRWYPRRKDVLIPDNPPDPSSGFPYNLPIQFDGAK